jgi:PAS domain-containing protein
MEGWWFIHTIRSEGLLIRNKDGVVVDKNERARFLLEKFPDLSHHLNEARVSMNLGSPTFLEQYVDRTTVEFEIQAEAFPDEKIGGLELVHVRPIPGWEALREKCVQYQYILETSGVGKCLFRIDLETTKSYSLLHNEAWLDLFKLTAPDMAQDGMLALGRRIAAADRERFDPIVEATMVEKGDLKTPFRVVRDGEIFWRHCKASYRGPEGGTELFSTISIEDYSEGIRQQELAELALGSSLSLACLMGELFDVQFYVDDTLRIVTRHKSLTRFFGGDIPASLHDVLSDAQSANELVRYLGSRPVMKFLSSTLDPLEFDRSSDDLPSMISVSLTLGGQAVDVQVFASSAFLDQEERKLQPSRIVEKPIVGSIVGITAPSEGMRSQQSRRFLVAMRQTSLGGSVRGNRRESDALSVIPVNKALSSDSLPAVVSLVFGRALRGLIMDSLSILASCSSNGPSFEFISLTFNPRNVSWCLEELLLVTPADVQRKVSIAATCLDFDSCFILLSDSFVPVSDLSSTIRAGYLGKALLGIHLLMGIAAQRSVGRLENLRRLDGVKSQLVDSLSKDALLYPISVSLELEFAALLAREATLTPSMFSDYENLSWLRKTILKSLSGPLRSMKDPSLQPVIPAVFFITLLFADFCVKSNRSGDARELLMGALDDLDMFQQAQCPELSSVKQLAVVLSHNLAIDALKRGDLIGTFNHILRLHGGHHSQLPPVTAKLVQWALSLQTGLLSRNA